VLAASAAFRGFSFRQRASCDEYSSDTAWGYWFFKRGVQIMRRILAILAALGFISVSIGCGHTHGVCDCDFGGYPNGWVNTYYPPAAATEAPPQNGSESLKTPTATQAPLQNGSEFLKTPTATQAPLQNGGEFLKTPTKVEAIQE
jgi:hypothetical protein